MLKNGLASYAIIRSGLSIIPIIITICVLLFFLKYYLSLDYRYSLGNIYQVSNNIDNSTSQRLSYVADISYNILLPKQPDNKLYNNGNTSVYYPIKTPALYSLSNPTYILEIFSCVCCLILLMSIFWFYILLTNPNFAAVDGGIEATNSLFSMFSKI